MGLSDKPLKEMDAKAFLQQANELADAVISAVEGTLTAKLREFKPQLEELRKDFRKLKGTQEIAGCKTWKQFCKEKLHRSDSAVRKLLAAGGKGKQKPAGEIPAPTPDEIKSKALKAIREYTQASPDNTPGSLFAELYPDGESTPPPTPVAAPDAANSDVSDLPDARPAPVEPSNQAAVTKCTETRALTPAEAFQDHAIQHFHGKSKTQVLKELGSIWSALFPNEAPLALHSDASEPKQKKPPVGERNSVAQIGDVQ